MAETTPNNKQKGDAGEDLAVDFLQNLGYKILKRNFRFGRDSEIDVVARHGDALVFVEVKLRTNDAYGDPLLSITPAKQKKLRSAAGGYLYVNKINDVECRFDVVAIEKRGDKVSFNHIQNAF